MFPYFYILSRQVSMYALMGILGIAIATILVILRNKNRLIPTLDLVYLSVYGALGGLCGAKLLFLITQAHSILSDLQAAPLSDVATRYFMAGFVFYGGLAGAFGGMYLYCLYRQLSFQEAAKLALPVVPLIHSFGRLGCFFAGCCHGIPWDPPLGIAFANSLSAPNHVHLLPVQLFEAAALLCIFILLWIFTNKSRPFSSTLCLYLLTYTPVRFFLEFFRGDENRGFLFHLSTSQLLSLLLFASATVYILYRHKNIVRKVFSFPVLLCLLGLGIPTTEIVPVLNIPAEEPSPAQDSNPGRMLTLQQIDFAEKEAKPPESEQNPRAALPEKEIAGPVYARIPAKMIALTFDDGPWEYTEWLLDELRARDVKATFFVIGVNARQYPELVTRMAQDGHEIGSHTYNHINLTKLSEHEIRAELDQSNKCISDLTGGIVPKLFRPPQGSSNELIKSICAEYDMSVVLWTVDTEDWKSKDEQDILNTAFQDGRHGVKNGAIVLLHDVYDTSVRASLTMIDRLKGESYTFVTVSELYDWKSHETHQQAVWSGTLAIDTASR